MVKLARRICESSRPIWSTLSEESLTSSLLGFRVWVLAVDGITRDDARCVDRCLEDIRGYLGALELHLDNEAHRVIYDRKLPVAYRIVGDPLRLLHTSLSLDPEARDEGARDRWAKAAVFQHVEWEDIGVQDTVFDEFATFDHAKRVAELEDLLGNHFGAVVSNLLLWLSTLHPRLPDGLHAALASFDAGASDEQLPHGALSCRRFLEHLADSLCPARAEAAGDRDLTQRAYKNRL